MARLGLKKYSIIIPSRNRQRYCVEAVQSALLAGRDDVQVIVADNSDDAALLPRLLEEAGVRDQITFLPSADRLLPMKENWERALDVVQGEWISYIGDDDGLHAESYEMMDLLTDNLSPKVLTWRPVYYKWPCFPGVDHGLMHITYESIGACVLRSETVMRNHMEWVHEDKWPSAGPSIYHGLVHFTVVAITRKLYGSYFLNYVVDYSSAITNATFIEEYIQYYWPISIMGACGNSNTAGLTSDGSGAKKIDHFFEENPERRADYDEYQESRLHAPWVIAGYSLLLDKIGLPFAMTPEKFARSVFAELVRVRDPETFAVEKQRLIDFADRHDLPEAFKANVAAAEHSPGKTFIGMIGQDNKSLYVDTAGFGWSGIHDVAKNFKSLMPSYEQYRLEHARMIVEIEKGAARLIKPDSPAMAYARDNGFASTPGVAPVVALAPQAAPQTAPSVREASFAAAAAQAAEAAERRAPEMAT